MPYSSLARGSLNHRPIFEGVTYVAQYRYTAPGAPATSSTITFNQQIDCPAVGPDRTLYLFVCTTRSSGGASYNTPTFNSRTMTVEIDSGNTYVKPIQWYSIKLLNSEFTGTFTWSEKSGAGNIYSAFIAAYIVRGKQTASAYTSSFITSGTSGTMTLQFTLNAPAYAKSIALVGVGKGTLDSADNTVYGSSNGFSAIGTSYPMTNSNGIVVAHGSTVNINLTASPIAVTYNVILNNATSYIGLMAGIVLY
jgi:hypothetical protein